MITIKNRFTGASLFECEVPSELAEASAARQLGFAVKEALKARADLAGADLARADLAGADLAGAYLAGAYLAGANLAGAYLAGAYLADAYLADAYLAGADLAGAYLAGAKDVPETAPADCRERQRLRAERFRARNPDVPVIPDIDARILSILESGKGKLYMATWHQCETTHCRGGWAVTLAGPAGAALEEKYGTQRAAAMIYRASTGRTPHFFASDERALEDIRQCAAEQVSQGVTGV
jgi:Pentapeptide repeats (8 copies)